VNRIALRPLPLFLSLLAASAPGAQSSSDAADTTTVSVQDLSLSRYVVQHVDQNALASTLESLMGRRLYLRENGDGAPPVLNLHLLGGSIVMYDTQDQVQRMLECLKRLDVPPDSSVYDQTVDYRPRFVTIMAAYEAVRGLVDVEFSQLRGTLTLSGSKGELDQARAYLATVDVPEKQVLLSCLLLEVGSAKTGSELPPELVSNLTTLLPGKQFSQVGMALLKTSVKAGEQVSVQIEARDEPNGWLRYRFGFQPVAFDEETSSLTVAKCSLVEEADSVLRPLFETSTLLRGGEYTVLAGTGMTTRLLVVRISPQP